MKFLSSIKQNYCNIILITFQVAFLGGGYNYINILQEMQKEIEPQLVRAEKLVKKVEKTGNSLEKTGQNVNNTIRSIESELKKVKKACKRIL